jgi:hypothetical protein
MATKLKANLQRPSYETVTKNIEKVTFPSGRKAYRIRVQVDGEKRSGTASSLKAAKELRAELVG